MPTECPLRVALLGHSSVETTMIYTHALNLGPQGVVSPADTL